jgi:hypothetical protein
MRTCVWCDAPLPEPKHKGHRRREFCPPPKTCKQQHYLWHKKMKQDVVTVQEPYWRIAYVVLVDQYKTLEALLQARLSDLEAERKRNDELEGLLRHYILMYEELKVDYIARLKALGMSESDIKDFDTYWKRQIETLL